MRPPFRILLLLSLFGLSQYLNAQAWNGILDPTRAIDWSQAGIPGGIPTTRTQCGTTLAASTYGNGSSDATSGIQTALNACGANTYLLLGPGVFRINSSLTIPSNKTLRGSGPDQTTLNAMGSSSDVIHFGAGANPSQGTNNSITAGASKGATSFTVSGSGISAGMLLQISADDVSYMTSAGSGGSCTWCNNGVGNLAGQTVEVIGVSGSTISFRPPLYFDYQTAGSPVAYRFTPSATSGGLENLKISSNNTGYTVVIDMVGTKYCWVKNVEDDFADNAHLYIYWGMGNEIRDNFFHDGYNHGPGGTDNQLTLGRKTSANLVVNNIFYRQHAAVMPEWGASGNVVAYNYMTGNYHYNGNATDVQWMINDTDWSHGAHPFFNLAEGNSGDKLQIDDYWGSESHSTLFRDYYRGSRQYVPPMNARGVLQAGSAQWEDSTGARAAIAIDSLVRYTNLVGTIVGSAHLTSASAAAFQISPTGNPWSTPSCIRIGFDNNNNAVSPNNTYSTAFIHGVNDCNTGAITWDVAHPNHSLPASFFLSGKPGWFSTPWGTPPWPAIGPDVTGGTADPGGHAHKIPAQLCFENSAKEATGRPIFNANNCYSQTVSSTVAAPTGLAASVH